VRSRLAVLGVAAALFALCGCASGTSTPARSSFSVPHPTLPPATLSATAAAPVPRTTSARPTPTHTRRAVPTHTVPAPPSSTSAAPPAADPPPAAGAPVIVIDPGHSATVHGTDAKTGLDVSDYENEPEMRDVFAVAKIVRRQLVHAGYRVVLTKPTVDTPTDLGKRAHLANRLHAALALSIHDQAGSNGGIQFDQGNNTVYYQAVGDYRETPSGKKVYFTDQHLAAISKRYGEIFQRKRAAAQSTSIALMSNTGYDLGSRGLQSGDMWIVQLLSKVPWIYNEAGGNSAGMVGLSSTDEHRYAAGLVAAVEACVPAGR
jgi:N-acetylmuramoyl-L-alanine amidase